MINLHDFRSLSTVETSVYVYCIYYCNNLINLLTVTSSYLLLMLNETKLTMASRENLHI